jgi:ABC-type uncharacterized transport system substrate-binding protein
MGNSGWDDSVELAPMQGLLPARARPPTAVFLAGLLAVGWLGAAIPEGTEVLVVSSSGPPAYRAAVEGLESVLNGTGVRLVKVTVDQPAGGELSGQLARRPALVVAVGSTAVEAVSSIEHDQPVVATMVLAPAAVTPEAGKVAATITLEVPPATVLARLKRIYPERKRIAVVRGPALTAASVAEIQAQARQHGYEVRVVEVAGPKELLEALGPLRERSDFVWCFPDNALYHGPVVPALILAAIRQGLPLIGFSEGMVRAGVLVGFYPDYRDVGVQTGETVLRRLEGRPVTVRQRPRTVKAAVNERVSRVLGVRFAPGYAAELEIVR